MFDGDYDSSNYFYLLCWINARFSTNYD